MCLVLQCAFPGNIIINNINIIGEERNASIEYAYFSNAAFVIFYALTFMHIYCRCLFAEKVITLKISLCMVLEIFVS
jgi:hypothetical protein